MSEFTVTGEVQSDDWKGCLMMKHGKIIPILYREWRRLNPQLTAAYAAWLSRPYIHPDGSVAEPRTPVAFDGSQYD